MKCLFQIVDCEFHCFSFDPIDSRMYIIISGHRALVVDPYVEENALQLLKDKNVNDIIILPTHEHYDHISGINWLRDNFRCCVIASEQCAKNMANPKYNASAHFDALFVFASKEVRTKVAEKKIKPYICTADEIFTDYKCFMWQNHNIEIYQAPGHSQGSVCIVIDGIYVFTGDSLLKGIPTITRLPGGSKDEYNKITLPFLKTLSPSAIIFPGHGEAGYLRDFFNPQGCIWR